MRNFSLRARASRMALGALPALAGVMLAATALAQSSTSSKEPPTAPIATVTRTGTLDIVTLLLVVVLAGAIVAVNFIPSKRGHQD